MRDYLEKFLADDRVIEIKPDAQKPQISRYGKQHVLYVLDHFCNGGMWLDATILSSLRPPLLKWLVLQVPAFESFYSTQMYSKGQPLTSLSVRESQALLLTRCQCCRVWENSARLQKLQRLKVQKIKVFSI